MDHDLLNAEQKGTASTEDNATKMDQENQKQEPGTRVGKKNKQKGPRKKLSKRKKIIAIVLLVAIVAVAYMWIKAGSESKAPLISIATAEVMDLQELVSIRGTVEGTESADVTSPLNYTIKTINVVEGDAVKKGQILAILDGSDLQTAYDLAESQYKQAQYNLQETLTKQQSEYDAALRAYDEAKRSYDAYKAVYEQGGISNADMLNYESDFLAKKAMVDAYTTSGGKVVASAAQKQALEVERLSLESKRKALDELNIKSPIDGTVTRVNATIGRLANETGTLGQTAMFVIENIENLQMNVMISQYDVNKLKIGQPVTITSDVMKADEVTGIVAHISPTGEEKNTNGTIEMVIPVRIDITEKNDKLLAGVTATADILVNEALQTLAIPLDALLQDMQTGESYVLIVNDKGILEKRIIETGLESDFYIEVTGDTLSAGDRLALNASSSMLTEGMSVTVQ